MSENKRSINLAEGEEYDEGGVGNYSKYTMVDENLSEAKKKVVDETEKEDIEDKEELEDLVYKFLFPYYRKRLKHDGKVKFLETGCRKCRGIELGTDFWMQLHNNEFHSESNKPIKYNCFKEDCTEEFDTRLERHLHCKNFHYLKFNINNLIKYGVTGDLLKRVVEDFTFEPENRVIKPYNSDKFTRRDREIFEEASEDRKKYLLKKRERDEREKEYYFKIKDTIDIACINRLRDGMVHLHETECGRCGQQLISVYWHRLHTDEYHKEEEPVKFDCFEEFCRRKFDTLEERSLHCTEYHKIKFDIDEFLSNGVHDNIYRYVKEEFASPEIRTTGRYDPYDSYDPYEQYNKYNGDEQIEELICIMRHVMKPRSVIMKEKNNK